MMINQDLISERIVEEFERPGPRYTSYPSIPFWSENISHESILSCLTSEVQKKSQLSAYFHLPFCEQLCHFCACHKVIDPRREHAERYLDSLIHEISHLTHHLQNKINLHQMHWGGGTPTFYSPKEIENFFYHLSRYFSWNETAELSIEANPTITTHEHLKMLRQLGFNRISFGVQDFDPKIQETINRHQTFEQTEFLIETTRNLGFSGINVDIIYGLPHQTDESIRKTIEAIITNNPDRLAFYSYATVPWKYPFQRRFQDTDLPVGLSKINLYLVGRELLLDAGYFQVGMDHFAREHDELFKARKSGLLHRNFMGYTTQPEAQLLGFGISAISMLDDLYWQNIKTLPEYYRRVGDKRVPSERGLSLSKDDKIRRFVIMQLMCNFRLNFQDLRERFEIDFKTYFDSTADILEGFEEKRLITINNNHLDILPLGQLFIRNIAMMFDAYLDYHKEYNRFSMTI